MNALITFVRRQEKVLVLLGLIAIVFFVTIDILVDLKAGLPFSHIFHELTILSFCVLLTLFQVRVITRQKKGIQSRDKEIADLTMSREEFKRKSLRFSEEFAEAVSQQFTLWHLTESERDVAILLIKGLSMKEIAEDRSSKEATVRQQAASIYRKAQLESRQQLTSFFLEDLFAPLPENHKAVGSKA